MFSKFQKAGQSGAKELSQQFQEMKGGYGSRPFARIIHARPSGNTRELCR
jgi:hypothetical protein